MTGFIRQAKMSRGSLDGLNILIGNFNLQATKNSEVSGVFNNKAFSKITLFIN